MAFNFNGNTPKKILYNGLNVAKLIYNGVVVWMSKVLATILGILPLTLTDCTGDDLVDYKIYGNTEEVLPRGYTQVEYLESTGTQYIDTGVKLSSNHGFDIKFLTANTIGVANYGCIFGGRNTPNNRDYQISTFSTASLWGTLRWGDTMSASPNITLNTVVQCSLKNKTFTSCNGTVTQLTTEGAQSDYNCFLFGLNNGTAGFAQSGNGCRIYYCKFYDGNNLIRNFIPCKNPSNVAGMYDTVNGVFYTNAGTETFNVGSVISKKSVGDLVTDASDINYGKYKIPVLTNSHTTNIYLNKPLRRVSKLPYGYTEIEHIRSTGTQYIDIGRRMYNNSELELCFSFDEMQQDCSIFGSRTSSTTNNFEIASQNPNFPIYLDFGHFNTSRATYNNAVINTKYICTISKSLRAVYDENRTLLVRNTALISEDNITPSNARIFDTAGGYSQNKLKGKVYYCKIWEDGVLIRDMIPCKNPSNVVGMYDTVNDVFYTNAGTGSFIAGAEVETVYYTDYLDYENQKVVRNVDDNGEGLDTPVEESVVLPAVSTDEGTTVFDVDTDVTPSYAEVKYYTKPIIENKTLKTSDNLVFITSDNKIFKLKEEE